MFRVNQINRSKILFSMFYTNDYELWMKEL